MTTRRRFCTPILSLLLACSGGSTGGTDTDASGSTGTSTSTSGGTTSTSGGTTSTSSGTSSGTSGGETMSSDTVTGTSTGGPEPFCGDGYIDPGELCDDANQVDDDACTNACTLPICGDAIVQVGEECDDGNMVNDDMCTNACTLPACGDGIVQGDEECDDGPLNSNKGACTLACKMNVCGDGFWHVGVEGCDDGPDNGEGKLCKADCSKNVCGDGDKSPLEQCDDGNVKSLDGCNAICNKEIECSGKVYACGNGFDDDMDGKVDGEDPECISPCDDNEDSFQTDLPGQNKDCKSDCYFDANSGQGDDLCVWNLQCDPNNPGADIGCPYDPDFKMCEMNLGEECIEFCKPNVPNGCDCFGCCEINGKHVYLDSNPECSIDNLDACNTCTFFEDCNNPCEPEKCELCFGQDPEDLPPECNEMPSCDMDKTPCTKDLDCGDNQYCQTGCCQVIPG